MTNGSIVAPQQRSVLISGIGVAGPAFAYWLLRTVGYVIDFWARGFDVAEKMGILPWLAAGQERR